MLSEAKDLTLDLEVLRRVYAEWNECAQHDSMVTPTASRGCHPELQG